ncbi:MAG: hypothetical protein NVS2B16_34260 [Chloroflexota bacterium]
MAPPGYASAGTGRTSGGPGSPPRQVSGSGTNSVVQRRGTRGIYTSKNTYYDALYQSQRNLHEATHSIWPWVTYLAEILAESYDAFEQRVAAEQRSHRKMNKQQRVRVHVLEYAPPAFTIDLLRKSLPGIELFYHWLGEALSVVNLVKTAQGWRISGLGLAQV